MKLPSGNVECQITVQGDFVLRTYSGQQAKTLLRVFNTGVLGELQAKGLLMPMTLQVNLNPNLEIVVRQQRGEVIYPAEWTSQLLAEVGLKTLELFEILDRYDCGLLDSHGQNWVLLVANPRFVDLGSFVPKKHKWEFLFPEFEFVLSFILPVELALKGQDLLGRLILNHERFSLVQREQVSHLLARPVERFALAFVPKKHKQQLRTLFYASYRELGATELPEKFVWALPLYRAFARGMAIPLSRHRVKRFRNFLNRAFIRLASTGTFWGEYAQSVDAGVDPRIDHVIGEIKKFAPSTVLDIGGNTGYLGRRYQAEVDTRCKYTVLDFDSDAVNIGTRLTRNGEGKVSLLQYDFVTPFSSPNLLSIQERFPADLVVSLALTHHLVLSGKMTFDLVAARYASLTQKWLLVEFMPLGLWVPGETGTTDGGYTRDNFLHAFQRYFEAVSETQLEVNRVLFTFRKRLDEKED